MEFCFTVERFRCCVTQESLEISWQSNQLGNFFSDAFLDVLGGIGLWNAVFNINNTIRETASDYFPYVAVGELVAWTAYVIKLVYKSMVKTTGWLG
jgi:hypothetical protein